MNGSSGASSAPVADLSAARAARQAPAPPDLMKCRCGSVWFQPVAVTVDADTARVVDYGHPVTCVECGAALPVSAR